MLEFLQPALWRGLDRRLRRAAGRPVRVAGMPAAGAVHAGGVRAGVPGLPAATMPADLPQPWEPSPDAPGRLGVAQSLWGRDYLWPGGEAELLRLARPLGLKSDANLLLLGAGMSGPALSIAKMFGCFVHGFEIEAALLRGAADRLAQAGPVAKRVALAPFHPAMPAFRTGYFHHALALEPLAHALPEPLLTGLAAALKPHGQLVLVDLVAGPAHDATAPHLAAWEALAGRSQPLTPLPQVETALGRLGFDVRVAEDVSDPYRRLVLAGWRRALAELGPAPPLAQVALLVAEAECWMLRLRLLRAGQLRLLRWVAIKKISV